MSSSVRGSAAVRSVDLPDEAPATWARSLRNAGLRVTKQRLAVLRALDDMPHATADDVCASVHATLPTMSVQSVYLVLHSLTDAGLLRRLDVSRGPSRYETRVADNHHHAVCSVCGRIEDVPCAIGSAPCLEPSDAHGMIIHTADVIYQGVCRDCALPTKTT